MKKYFIKLADTGNENILEILDENNARFNSNGFDYEYKFLTDEVLILRIDNKNFFLTVSYDQIENNYEIKLNSRLYKVICKNNLDIMMDQATNKNEGNKHKNKIFSPMPGIINKLNVKENQMVNKGDVLLVLEAMKMENEIKAQRDCMVKKVNIEAMKSVEKGELLIELE